jgi:tRNA A-37 threonylcarbamoyl transferase component Bud32
LGGDKPSIHLGRPGGAPAAIFSPVLARLQHHLDHLEQVVVSRRDVERAAEYVRCAVAFYDNEDLRQKAIRDVVNSAIGEVGEWERSLDWADKIKPHGGWWYETFLILVLELKNALGLSGDALLQAVIDYSKIVSREKVRFPIPAASNSMAHLCLKYKRFRDFCNFPVVLVGATANRLEISVAVCVGSVYVSKLLTFDLSLGFHASDNIIRLARVFWALSDCRVDLQNYYHEVGKLRSPRLSCLFPSPTLVDSSKALPELTYRQFLSRAGQPTSALVDLGNATTAMYIATLGGTGKQVIVKFTARYNEEAHNLLTKVGLAPGLHFCERVIGDLYMVVMDRVDGKSIWQLQGDKIPVPAIVSERVRDAVLLLHENNIVFGDLRDPNILYDVSNDRVVLVDFDWAGKDGESRYPATLNHGNVWAEDVSAYSIMKKDHDIWQLNRLIALCNSHA